MVFCVRFIFFKVGGYVGSYYEMKHLSMRDVAMYQLSPLFPPMKFLNSLQWRHDERDGVSNHRRLDGLLNRLFWRRQ